MRITLTDIARTAGVSTATVDRVLNNRSLVRQRTRDIVLSAAKELGYLPDANSIEAPPDRQLTFDFVLPAGRSGFMQDLRRQLELHAAERGVEARIHEVQTFEPESLAQKLHEIGGQSDCIGLLALDHPIVREAIRSLAQRGVDIVTLVSDIHHVPRIGYVGIDNRSAGRLAGYLLGRLLGRGQHKVALFAGSLSYRGHEEREMGFHHALLETPGQLSVVGLSEIRDDRTRAYEATRELLARHHDLAAIYNIGAGNSGIGQALEESGRARDIIFIGHDLTDFTKRALLNSVMDVVIDQNPRVQARDVIDQMIRRASGAPWSLLPIRIQAIFRENIPEA